MNNISTVDKSKKKQKGFTLIETVLYLAIVGILFVAVINFHLILGGNITKLSSNIEVSRNRRIALSSIEYMIRNADGFWKDINGECSDFSDPSLALFFDDDTYLPGTCVENGGGVRIALEGQRLKISCHPNIQYNGQYNACEATSSGDYYLTNDRVRINAGDLSFSTSTATSTSNGFVAVTTYIRTSILSNDQVDLKASSGATSTIALRNEQPSGLVTWWQFVEGTGTTTVDFAGNNPAGCYPAQAPGAVPTWTTGIVSSSPYALNFEYDDRPSVCMTFDPATETQTNPDDLNFDDQFSIMAWVKPEALTGTEAHNIINKANATYNKGYKLDFVSSASSAKVRCRIFNGTTYYDLDSPDAIITAGDTYHVACIYNRSNDRLQLYVYESGTGVIASTTYSGTVPILVNDYLEPHISYQEAFDGIIDEVRFYNRALNEEELFALYTQAP